MAQDPTHLPYREIKVLLPCDNSLAKRRVD